MVELLFGEAYERIATRMRQSVSELNHTLVFEGMPAETASQVVMMSASE